MLLKSFRNSISKLESSNIKTIKALSFPFLKASSIQPDDQMTYMTQADNEGQYNENMFNGNHTLSGKDSTFWNITQSKQSNSDVSIYHPLLSFHVRATAVIHETRIISLGTSVNDPANISIIMKVSGDLQN